MEAETLIKKYCFRVYLACFCATVLALGAVLITGFPLWLAIVCLAIVILDFYDRIRTLKRELKLGQVVLVYGTCVSKDIAPGLFRKNKKELAKNKNASLLVYRFVSISASQAKSLAGESQDDFADLDDSGASFYIKAEPGKYHENESYAFLFYLKYEQGSNGEKRLSPYTEKNLIISDVMEQMPYSEKVSSDVDGNIGVFAEDGEAIAIGEPTEEDITTTLPSNGIRFVPKGD